MRLLWLVGGFAGGVAVARNAEPMGGATMAAVVLGVLLLAGGFFWGSRRDRASAVASAVAVAVASSEASAEARLEAALAAVAVAHGGSVNVYAGEPGPWDAPARHARTVVVGKGRGEGQLADPDPADSIDPPWLAPGILVRGTVVEVE